MNRYFNKDIRRILKEIARDIADRQFSNFGEFLKGAEGFEEEKDTDETTGDEIAKEPTYIGTNHISRQAFFQLFETMFGHTLGNGDIIDLLNYFDKNNQG